MLSRRTQIQIPARTTIGEGFYIGHSGRIIINPDAVLGKNINIATGVTIGQENRGKRKGCPTIGDRVWIGTNSVVVGNIRIGSDVLIAPLTLVNFDVPDHSVVIGNPAKIISREDATAGYIEKTV
ncbi:MAG: serine acetyltransferase [Oscillospiraceae bacterium]|nr:serine acetyltransferase [Oscillospiraceae bacterium]MBR2366716.1 serine acetyltransferase [Oscillospiraceae bacterium]MBR2896714.1 serine acetyltransferase [Oscillospiraceae bacterium]MBR2976978.1 serine acetyltransferase [Oscillospiraceae bacterium]